MSLGGDASTGQTAIGYTDSHGVPHGLTAPKKSTVLVWQVGNARKASQDGTTDVFVNTLHAPTMGKWNHYTVNVTTGALSWTDGAQSASASPTGTGTSLNALPSADQPDTRDGRPDLRQDGGGDDRHRVRRRLLRRLRRRVGYGELSGARVRRPQRADQLARAATLFNTATFRMYPAREMGQTYHANQFVFTPSSAADYYDNANDNLNAFHTPEPYGDDNALCASSNTTSAPWPVPKPRRGQHRLGAADRRLSSTD